MFDVLMGSKSRRERSVWRGVASAFCHLAVIAGVARATAHQDTPAPVRVDTIVIADYPPPEPPPGQPVAPAGQHPGSPPMPLPEAPPPVDVPPGIPAPDLLDRRSAGDLVRTWDRSGPIGDSVAGGDSVPVWVPSAAEVDQPARVLVPGVPRYPPVLRAGGIEGRVVMRFVIDTEGRVEPESLRVVGSSHAGFENAAREAVMATRFRPARMLGRTVRQWVEQAVTFRLAR